MGMTKNCNRRLRGYDLASTCLILAAIAFSGRAAERLPSFLDAPRSDKTDATQVWTMADTVEVRRITDTAVSDKTQQLAFIVKQSFIDSDDIRYGLYVAERHDRGARKIREAAYIDQLSWHPGTNRWTARADFGSGIQLYDIDSGGREYALVVNPRTVMIGAAESVIDGEPAEGPRKTGIASYEWAPDGRSLWYSAYRLRDATDRVAMADRGITYDDREMYMHAFVNDPTIVLGAELHWLRPEEAIDRSLIFVPGGSRVGKIFNHKGGSAFWEKDSRHIQYFLFLLKPDGSPDISKWSIDTVSGVPRRWSDKGLHSVFSAVPAPDGLGYLTVDLVGQARYLIQLDIEGKVVRNYGRVEFHDVSSEQGFGAWYFPRGRGLILAVSYSDRSGLVTIPASRGGVALASVKDSLSHCSFTKDASYGICVRESQTTAPEIVEVSVETGTVKPKVQVNRDYAEIQPLHVERAQWMNRFDNLNDGFITYPRGYVAGRQYPTIVVTHGHDAINEFANDAFQWEFPVQVLAERGYLVLSVNEPTTTASIRAASDTRMGIQASLTVQEVQKSQAFNAVASMEAALESAIKKGLADETKTGIAGYSRGAEIVEWAMTQSKLFHAAVEGDAGGFQAGHYGLAGTPYRSYYRQLYGGSPFDPAALDNHLRLSTSFRAKKFAGPFLELFAKTNAPVALELHSLLQDEQIPTELIFFPDESHIFWDPRHRAAAMWHTVNWFDYWLLGKRNAGADSEQQYARWDAMASLWKNRPDNGASRH